MVPLVRALATRPNTIILGVGPRESIRAGGGDPTMEPLRVGLCGCSWFALRAHVPALLALERAGGGCRGFAVRVDAVCSRTKKSMAKAEAKLGRAVRRHAQMQALFDDPAIDVVLLVLPIPLMADAVEAALRAGKHVISEKPAAASLERTLALLALQRSLPAPAPMWSRAGRGRPGVARTRSDGRHSPCLDLC